MKPKEKAKELYEKYAVMWHASTKDVKQCALICVEEILEAVTTIADKKYEYYQEVKTEIEKL